MKLVVDAGCDGFFSGGKDGLAKRGDVKISCYGNGPAGPRGLSVSCGWDSRSAKIGALQ